ncbi:unnamed protein product [Rotaria sordida]|uniref:Hint domain-containing protein n=1 Tax=Rotaria sordida TaxID=392033 RepID=A0A814UIJ4_9BILA|nr:unnamed protein product [Rotaria sordida]CAF1172723.1 unnamed protein product [Rotaria sordida]CAF1227388.1 unnamed protein product [Rotaria sordida]
MIRFVFLSPCKETPTTTTTTTKTTTTKATTTTRARPTTVTPCRCDCNCPKCFSKYTNVTLDDGSRRPISRLRIGDRVLVYDKDRIISSPVLAILTHLNAPIIDFIVLHTSDAALRLTPAHFILVRKQNEKINKPSLLAPIGINVAG